MSFTNRNKEEKERERERCNSLTNNIYYNRHVILYPNGKNETNQVSLYLTSEDVKNGTSTSDICAQVILCMVDPIDSVRHFRQGRNN